MKTKAKLIFKMDRSFLLVVALIVIKSNQEDLPETTTYPPDLTIDNNSIEIDETIPDSIPESNLTITPENIIPETPTVNSNGSSPSPSISKIVYKLIEMDGKGTFRWRLSNSDGFRMEQIGFLKNVSGRSESVQVLGGTFEYTSVNGKPVLISYIIDENGLRLLNNTHNQNETSNPVGSTNFELVPEISRFEQVQKMREQFLEITRKLVQNQQNHLPKVEEKPKEKKKVEDDLVPIVKGTGITSVNDFIRSILTRGIPVVVITNPSPSVSLPLNPSDIMIDPSNKVKSTFTIIK